MSNQTAKNQTKSNIEKLTAALLLAGYCIAPGTIKGRPVQLVITAVNAVRSAA